MAFSTVPKQFSRGRKPYFERVSIGRMGKGQISFTISADLLERMKINPNEFVSIQLGDGEHSGFIRIVKADEKDTKSARKVSAQNINAPRITAKADSLGMMLPEQTTDLDWFFDDSGAIVISIQPFLEKR